MKELNEQELIEISTKYREYLFKEWEELFDEQWAKTLCEAFENIDNINKQDIGI